MTDIEAQGAVTMEELLERVRKAEGGNRELDAALFVVLVPNPRDPWRYWHADMERPGIVLDGPHDAQAENAPAYTTSLDAALALMEAKLPGCRWNVWKNRQGIHGAEVCMDLAGGVSKGSTPALALVAILLKTLMAQERQLPAQPEEEQR